MLNIQIVDEKWVEEETKYSDFVHLFSGEPFLATRGILCMPMSYVMRATVVKIEGFYRTNNLYSHDIHFAMIFEKQQNQRKQRLRINKFTRSGCNKSFFFCVRLFLFCSNSIQCVERIQFRTMLRPKSYYTKSNKSNNRVGRQTTCIKISSNSISDASISSHFLYSSLTLSFLCWKVIKVTVNYEQSAWNYSNTWKFEATLD